ncbi:MAG: transposase [Chloroflexi bacterium]|nr:MAG: transposase [Chloroflexota bacterium]
MNQLSLANGFERSTRRTRRPAFVEEMLAVVPWDALVARIASFTPAGTTGRPPYPVILLPRVHFLQQWFSLADEVAREALHDIPVYRAFAGIAPGATGIPDATTIQRFRHLLERRHLATALLRTVNEVLEAQGQMVRRGTLVDVDLHPRSG